MTLVFACIIIIAMNKKRKHRPLHLEIQKQGNSYCGVIRSSYRENGKVNHSNHGRITGLPLNELKILQAAFRKDVVLKSSPQALKTKQSKEYGASFAILELAKKLELDKAIYSKPEKQWVRDSLAMIIGRIIYAGSKLSLSNEWKNTALWELCGVKGKINVEEHCYKSMDILFARQSAIQRILAKKHLGSTSLVLYDITSSYFEGEYKYSDIVTFGYNRDGKRHHEQMVIGLICDPSGCPVGVEVFPGNTQDAKTVVDKINQIQKDYGVSEIIFVGDRGMVTHANYEKVKNIKGLNIISALTHRQIVELLDRKVIQMGLFDEKEIIEAIDPEDIKKRYCLCKNPDSSKRESKTREELLTRTKKELEKISSGKRKSSIEVISARVGKILAKYKMGKFVNWEIKEGKLKWNFNNKKIEEEKLLDGCYIITSDVPAEKMNKQEIVASYKKLELVETAFRNLKTVQLEIRPVYHKTDDRIRCHVFICMLAYYLQWHIKKMLKPLFDSDGKHENREWTFENVISRLTTIRREIAEINGVSFYQINSLEEDQKYIFDLLGVRV